MKEKEKEKEESQIKPVNTPDAPFNTVTGLFKIEKVDGKTNIKVQKVEIIDLRLLKHLLLFIQENEGKDCTSVELVTIDTGQQGQPKIIGFRTEHQAGGDEMYMLAALYQHHQEKTIVKSRFKDVSKKLYVKLPVYDESVPKPIKNDRFTMMARAMEIDNSSEDRGSDA